MKKLLILVSLVIFLVAGNLPPEPTPESELVVDSIIIIDQKEYNPSPVQNFIWQEEYGVITESDILDLPVGPWINIYWNHAESWGRWQHTDDKGNIWIIQAHCLEPDQKEPYIGQEFYRDGRKLFSYTNQNTVQDMGIDFIIEEPEDTSSTNGLWWMNMYRVGCTCDGYTADIFIDGVLVKSDIRLDEYPNMAISDYYMNLFPGQKVTVRLKWFGMDIHYDSDFSWATLQINCDNKPATVLDCSSGECPKWGCEKMNGLEECRMTITAQTCTMCLGRWIGADPVR